MDALPRSEATAAANMALDLLLLTAYPDPRVSRLRCYGWTEPAHTFGVSQRWAEWRPRAPESCALVRRPTGGGLVSHLADWTFALAVPSGHAVCAMDATRSYAVVLDALREALNAQSQGVASVPRPSAPRPYQVPGVCGDRPEPHDLVTADGSKVAGAAQKRTREGLLLQGYVERGALPRCDWGRLGRDFSRALADALGEEAREPGAPEYPAGLLSGEIARFASREWNERI